MKWILIIILISGYGDAVTTQEFNTQKACVDARDSIPDTGWVHTTKAICVPKGEEPIKKCDDGLLEDKP